MNLAEKIAWLDSRGGRTIEDMLTDENGDYVSMSIGTESTKVYLPDVWIRN